MRLVELRASPFSVSRYRTWMAVLESRILERSPSSLAISTCPLALMILLSAFLRAMGAETSSRSRSALIPKSA